MKPYYCGVQTSKCWQNRGGVICLPCTRISSAGPLSGGRVSLHRFVNPKYQGEEFPGGPGVKTLCFHCRRRRAQSLVGEPHLGSHRAMSLSAPSSSPISPPLAWVVHPTAANGWAALLDPGHATLEHTLVSIPTHPYLVITFALKCLPLCLQEGRLGHMSDPWSWTLKQTLYTP